MRRHSLSVQPKGSRGAMPPPASIMRAVKKEADDVKPKIKIEDGEPSLVRRARSASTMPQQAGKVLSSTSGRIRKLLTRHRRSSTISHARSQSLQRGSSVLSTTSSMTSSGLRYDAPPGSTRARASAAPSNTMISSTDDEEEQEESNSNDEDDEVIEVSSPIRSRPAVPSSARSEATEDYVTFTLKLEAPALFPWPQTVSFTAPRLKDWTVAGLNNQRQLKRCSRIIQETILNLYQAQ